MSECPYSFSEGQQCVLPPNRRGKCLMRDRAAECAFLRLYGPLIESVAAPLRVRAEAAEADLALNATMLARQCDLAREAEIQRDAWRQDAERLAEAGQEMRMGIGLLLCFVSGREYRDRQTTADAWDAVLAAHEDLKRKMGE